MFHNIQHNGSRLQDRCRQSSLMLLQNPDDLLDRRCRIRQGWAVPEPEGGAMIDLALRGLIAVALLGFLFTVLGLISMGIRGDSTGNCQTSSLQRESGRQSTWGKTKPVYLKATLIGQLRRSSRHRQLRHQWIDFLALSPVPGRSFEAALIFWCKVDAKVTLPDGDRVVIGLLREAEGEAAFIYCRAIHSIAHLGKSQAVAAGRGRPLRRGRTCVLDGIEFNTNIHEYREILRSSLRKPRVPWP
jgi:hypothetical protein